MSVPDPQVRALLEAARGARPSAEARARIDAGLATQLGLPTPQSPATAQPAAPPPAPIVAAPAIKLVTAAVLVSALAAAAGAIVWRRSSIEVPLTTPGPLPAAPPSAIVGPTPLPEPAVSASALPTGARPIADPPPRAVRRGPPPSPSATALDEEVALLRSAQQALKRGDAATALAELDALGARHPDGVLREERLTARVLALCAAGRVDEARDAGRLFLAEMPTSVQADRVRASCALAAPSP